MRIFITGATGWIGSALTKDLLAAGHSVIALARTNEKARELSELGAEPVLGTIDDVGVLIAGAKNADAVAHLAFGAGGMDRMAEAAEADRTAIETFGNVFAGSERMILVTGGIGTVPPGQVFTEQTPQPINPNLPRFSEPTAMVLADRGLNATTIRIPRSVHGSGESHGFIPRLIALARTKGLSAYVGDGDNLWPSVHRLDAARLYRLALERGIADGPFHAVAEEGTRFKSIAQAIGRGFGLPIRSISPEEAMSHFGFLTMPVRSNGPANNDQTRQRLGWQPKEVTFIADIARNYF